MEACSPRHTPVLVDEVLGILRPEGPGLYVDGTLGLGGHTEALLQQGHPDLRVLALDRDAESLERAKERLQPFADRVEYLHMDYREAPLYLKKVAWPARCPAGCSISESAPCTWTSQNEAFRSFMRGPST